MLALCISPAWSQGGTDAALATYALTMANVRKMAAAYEHIDDALKSNPAVAAKLAKGEGVTSAEQLIHLYQQEPVLQKAVASAGIDTRDLVLTQFALFTAGMNEYAAKSGGSPPTGKTAAANLKVYQQNRSEIDQITAKLKTLDSWQAQQGDDSDD